MMLSLQSAWLDPGWMLGQFGPQMLVVSAAVVFAECGLLFPFLPGDSLLFSMGMFVRSGQTGRPGIDVSLPVVVLVLAAAAFLGNVAGYEIGRLAGPWVYRRDGRVVRREHIDRTRAFLDRRGRSAVVVARFVPVVRTFVSVVAGAAGMPRRAFLEASATGALAWSTSLATAGYLFWNVGFLQRHIDLVVLVVVVLPLLPGVLHALEQRRRPPAGPTASRWRLGDAVPAAPRPATGDRPRPRRER